MSEEIHNPQEAFEDTSDLPSASPTQPTPALNKAGRPYDPATGKLLPKNPEVVAPPVSAAEPVQSPPVESATVATPETVAPVIRHSQTLLQAARQAGIPEQEILSTPSDQLREDVKLLHQIRAQAKPEPVVAETPIDWGINPETNEPFSEKDYPAPVAKAIRAAHENEKLKKAHEELKAELQREKQDRETAAIRAQFDAFFSKRPDLYTGDPSVVEARQNAILAQVNLMLKSGRATNIQADCAAAEKLLFGAPPAQDATGRITPEQWAKAGLAQPTNRASNQPELSRRERMIREEYARARENGQVVVPEDNSDLPRAN